MVHAVSASYLQSEHMSPPAAGLALALHVTVALALWWVSPLKFVEPESEPIEVTMEAPPPKPPQAQPTPAPAPPQAPPAAAAPPAPAPQAAPPRPTSKAPLGLPSPAPDTADKPTQEPPKKEPKTEEPQQATAPAKPEPEPPPVEKSLPPVEAPPPPLTMHDFVKIAPPPPPHEVVKPLPQQVTPRPPPAPQQALRPSPLSTHPQQQAPDSRSPTAPQNTFVNPADLARRNTLVEEYLLQVTRKFSQYVYYTRDAHEQGTVVVRFTIARDGRLTESSILRSSGFVTIDKEVLDALRRAAPYPPLPAGLPGESVTFNLPISSRYQR